MSVFRGPDGWLRPGWRVALWALPAFVLVSAAGAFGGALPLWARLAALTLLLLALSLGVWRLLEGRAPAETPLPLDRRAPAAFGRGLAIGAILVALAVGLLAASGAIAWDARACDAGDLAASFGRLLVFLLFAAAAEELLFRGYALFALEDGAGRAVAIAVTSALFALAHVGNPSFGWLAAANLALVGAVLAAMALSARSVWLPIGIHLGWNWTLATLAALPVSGLALPSPCWAGAVAGPVWWTGGEFGLEGGVAATAVWALAAVVLARRAPRVKS